jgi:hypothetical protein
MDSPQNLQRHRSTKLLIDRYESMSGAQPVYSQSSFHGAKALSSGLGPSKFSISNKKDKSPIRQSLRNLFSVFKKVNITGKAKAEERTLATYRPDPCVTYFAIIIRPRFRAHSPSQEARWSALVPFPHVPTLSQLSYSSRLDNLYGICRDRKDRDILANHPGEPVHPHYPAF